MSVTEEPRTLGVRLEPVDRLYTFFFYFFFPLSEHNHQTDFCRYGAYWVCLCSHNPPNADMNYRIFNVYIGGNAWDCTRGCVDT